MKFVGLLLLLALTGGSRLCRGETIASENTIDITGETVKHVESLLAKNPKLPRLTRGEIVSLIEEVRNRSSPPLLLPGSRDEKSLLVVLPVNNSTTSSSMEELFTKEAVTRYIGEPPSTTTSRPKRRRKRPTNQPRPVYQHSTPTNTRPETPVTFGQALPPYRQDLQLPNQMKETLVEISINPTEDPKVFVTPNRTPSSPKPTAPPLPSGVQNTADALTPDIRQVLNSIGLFGESTTEKPSFFLKAVAPSIDPTTYSRFKPLPSSPDVSDDMKSFLKSFGLLDAPSRQKKAMREPSQQDESEPFINEYILTDDMKDILRNIGLMDRKSKKMHVFNPHEEAAKLNQTEQMMKINKLLKKLREVSEGGNENVTQEELKELIALDGGDEYNRTLLESELEAGLSADEYQSLETKNEVKRQQPNINTEASTSASNSSDSGSSSSANTTASASAEDASSSSTESSTSPSDDDSSSASSDTSPPAETASSTESTGVTGPSAVASTDSTERSPSLDELADSFGSPEISTRRPNGFYFMLDWNSFLDVGLEDRKISLNFSPKVGDPRNFLPVTFP